MRREPRAKLRHVIVGDVVRRAGLHRSPRQVARHDGSVVEGVPGEAPSDPLVILQDLDDVEVGVIKSHPPRPLHLIYKVACPVGELLLVLHRVVVVRQGEVLRRDLRHQLPILLLLDLIQRAGEVAHHPVRRTLRHRHVRPARHVIRPVAVYADEVKGVQQPPLGWVGGVVGVEKLPLVVDDRPACRVSVGVRPAVGRSRRGVDPGEEVTQHVVDRVRPAEAAHDAPLGGRVLRSVRHSAPLGKGIRPREPLVHRHRVAVKGLREKLPVRRARRPEHQPLRLIGRGVKLLLSDQLRHPCGEGGVLLPCHIPGEGHHKPQPLPLLRV